MAAQSMAFSPSDQKSSSSMGRLKAELHGLRSGRVMPRSPFAVNNAGKQFFRLALQALYGK
jgi:hypothetical protein